MPEVERMKLGKGEYKHDPRTLAMADFLTTLIAHPSKFDFDANRLPFPHNLWGNDQYGDCVIAGRTNHLLRLERAETRSTIPVTDTDAINKYKQLTGCASPGDDKDTGLVVLDALKDWKNNGWDLKSSKLGPVRNYKISAYGELDVNDIEQQKAAIYVLHGIQLGYWLPWAASSMTKNKVWDYNGETGDDWEPGSWGGHLVYSKAYNSHGLFVRTWGMDVLVTQAFHKKYCDESWAVVDSLDKWRAHPEFDVNALIQKLRDLGGHVGV